MAKKSRNFSVELDLWEQAKRVAAPVPISRLISQLLIMWLSGLIEVDWTLTVTSLNLKEE